MKDNRLYMEKTGLLSPALVDEYSELTGELLSRMGVERKDVLRFRLSMENAMLVWLEQLGEGQETGLLIRKRFGRLIVKLTCKGPSCDPRETSSEEFGNLADSAMFDVLGLSVRYRYERGCNILNFTPPGSGVSAGLLPVGIALILGLLAAFLVMLLIPEKAETISSGIITPVFDALMDLLRTIAGPLIFLAVLSGIYNIGDVATLGKIGRKLFARYLLMTYVFLLVTFAALLPFITIEAGTVSGDGSGTGALLSMILQFVPTDIVSPFLSGNMLQIIFLAVACGLGILILGERVSNLADIIGQIYALVQLLMEAIGKMIPLFVFISIFDFVLSGYWKDSASFLIPFAAILGPFVLVALSYAVVIRAKYKVGIRLLFMKLLPTYLTALSTASSAAAFSVNVDTCEKRLGISENITRFGIPLGQVVYMPLAAAEYLSICAALAISFDVPVTPVFLVIAIFISGILAIATPPIPGGALSIFTVLFAQLGIPTEAMGIAIGIDLIVDYFVTAGDLTCLQEELVLDAGSMGYLNEEVLRKE